VTAGDDETEEGVAGERRSGGAGRREEIRRGLGSKRRDLRSRSGAGFAAAGLA
jgi:hypothetical protein